MTATSTSITKEDIPSNGISKNVFPTKEIKRPEQITRVFDFLAYQENLFPKPDMVVSKVNGEWKPVSTAELRKQADLLSLALIKLGIKKGDSVAISSENRPEWNFVDLAVVQLGAILVPLYPNASSSDYEYILKHAEVKIAFCSKEEFYNKMSAAKVNLPDLQEIYTFEKVANAKNWKEITEQVSHEDTSILEIYRQAVEPDDVMTLMYTSGTTGQPKGVMIMHSNLVSNIFSTLKIDLTGKGDSTQKRALSFLPLCHVYEKSVFYSYLFQGVSIYYAESIETIGANLQEVKPHGFTTVPRLLEKVFEKIEAKANELTGLKKMIFKWSMKLADKFDPEGNNGGFYGFQLGIARKLVFSKWKAALGGHVEFVISGAAALNPKLARIFWAAEIPILEGYGLSESTPSFSVNSFGEGMHKVGTVGRMLPFIEGKIIPEEGYRPGEGEIVCKGPNVMKGYYKQPEITAETIIDGWLHTGDIGMYVDKNGKTVVLAEGQSVTSADPYFLKITDRKKEVFKTSGGKYIAPLQLETKFKESPFIEQMMVAGENQKFPSALFVPSFENLKSWCRENNIPVESNEAIIRHPDVVKKYEEILERYNEGFGNYERIKKFALLPQEWTIETNELTPTLKMKRRIITANYKDIIDGFYKE